MMKSLIAPICLVTAAIGFAQSAAQTTTAKDEKAVSATAGDKNAGGDDMQAPAAGDKAARDADSGSGGEPNQALDASLRTFAGECVAETPGNEPQAQSLVGAALTGFIPQIASAGIDALTNALDKAGQDQVVTFTAVAPLENRPRCIQIARGVTLSSRVALADTSGEALHTALLKAPFMVEFYIRPSRDGSAIVVMPTMMRYTQTLDGKKAGGGPRKMFATLTFSNVGGSDTASVSVPLGDFRPNKNSDTHFFDAVGAPIYPGGRYPAGAAASIWIKSPYVVLGANTASAPATGSVATGDATSQQKSVAKTNAGNPDKTTLGANASSSGGSFSTDTLPPAAAGAAAQPGNPAAGLMTAVPQRGAEIRPVTIAVTFRETRPGSAFARAVSTILKGNKQMVVDAVDPAKQAEAEAADLNTWKTNQTAYATALGDFYKKRTTYCTGITDVEQLKDREAEGADLLQAEIGLSAAAQVAKITTLPFKAMVDPSNPTMTTCTGWPG